MTEPERWRNQSSERCERERARQHSGWSAGEDLAKRQREIPLAELTARAAGMLPARDPRPVFRSPGVSVIAEVKRKIPSKYV